MPCDPNLVSSAFYTIPIFPSFTCSTMYVADLHVRLLFKDYGSYFKGYGCLSRILLL